MTQYIADEAHFKEVIARVPKVKRSLWIGTADIRICMWRSGRSWDSLRT